MTAEQLANALALYVEGDARLVGVEEPDCADGANLLRFRVEAAPSQGGDDQQADPKGPNHD
ncbi:hypothetical protein MXD59_23745 [Frankia sp. Ag45/Mut15]|uniref:Uncharacterized protein n=1 Tax=Frankia umida TaxID=573489 RepID=A0ABT0K4M3_9ACTN|nr:hypothetical protein [Frankia umida]